MTHPIANAQDIQEANPDARARATLGGGCFWCLDAVFRRVPGVEQVTAGYAGGHVPHPTYEQVCTGQTGHAEVVQVEFDPEVVSYKELVEWFFRAHDPTQLNRQGADVGPQYRSIILTDSPAQEETARAVMTALTAAKTFSAPIVTEVVALDRFYPAEATHQAYYDRNQRAPYCVFVIQPKLEHLRLAD
ncbi:MAG: peptide-methionine (S)-S-oxide reductase MsrA [Candidatus Marinimicrobia bacterium]|nr:peptide-methionine (S)-S-oxide reductase MsrA [Candidatus Neomarinimicrobiota bacterium]